MNLTHTERLLRVLETLWNAHGRPEPDEGDDLLGLLIRMMLGQATSKANASAAFGNLLDTFEGDWTLVCAAPVDEVVAAIEVGGLATQKAPRIQKLLREVHARFGDHTLEPVRDWDADEALEFVLGFDGVGPTTARFTLMAGAGMDVFPMNGGIKRLLGRVGVLDPALSDAAAHAHVQSLLQPGHAYPAHMTLVAHARTTCKPKPLCGGCPARPSCVFALNGDVA